MVCCVPSSKFSNTLKVKKDCKKDALLLAFVKSYGPHRIPSMQLLDGDGSDGRNFGLANRIKAFFAVESIGSVDGCQQNVCFGVLSASFYSFYVAKSKLSQRQQPIYALHNLGKSLSVLQTHNAYAHSDRR